MPIMDKRTFLKVLAIGTSGAGAVPWLFQQAQAESAKPAEMPKDYYSVPKGVKHESCIQPMFMVNYYLFISASLM